MRNIWFTLYSKFRTCAGRTLYWLLLRANSAHKLEAPTKNSIRVVCISDTHGAHGRISTLPEGDILVHAGDLTEFGSYEEAEAALDWLNSQKHPHKIVVFGNHDIVFTDFERRQQLISKYPGIVFLHDESAILTVRDREFRIYGHAQVPRSYFPAFQYEPILHANAEEGAERLWGNIPENIDILITHGPPAYHLDFDTGKPRGCPSLLHVLWRVKPRLHIFGHIHPCRGIERLYWSPAQAAYERLSGGEGSWHDFFLIARQYLAVLTGRTIPKGEFEKSTILANVASRFMWFDDIVRDATVVEI